MATNLVALKPHSDPARWVVVYPVYLNSKKTTEEGRKINKQLAVEDPTINEIHDICQANNFPCVPERKMHPRNPERDNFMLQGRIRVQIKKDDGTPLNPSITTRMALYKHIAELIPKLKSRQQGGAAAPTSGAAASSGAAGGNKKNKKKR